MYNSPQINPRDCINNYMGFINDEERLNITTRHLMDDDVQIPIPPPPIRRTRVNRQGRGRG